MNASAHFLRGAASSSPERVATQPATTCLQPATIRRSPPRPLSPTPPPVNEIRVLGSLHHPNIVRQYETFMAGNKLCIVMELAPAGARAGARRKGVAQRGTPCGACTACSPLQPALAHQLTGAPPRPAPRRTLPAGDLAGFIRAAAASGRPLPEGTVWQVFLQLCQGVAAVHDACVIHRDIKPANIFMCPDNIVKVGGERE